MARSSGGVPQAPSEPVLAVTLDVASTKIQSQVEAGEQIRLAMNNVRTVDDIESCQRRVWTWHEYNETLLRKLLGPGSEQVYRQLISFGGGSSPQEKARDVVRDLDYYQRQLTSVLERLPLWAIEDDSEEARVNSAGPIFIVHGRHLGRANEVARVLERVTTRKVVILHEEANAGQTILEKFELHASSAAFAVVLLTSDDEGRLRDSQEDLRPRGRQNVVLEMGYFLGKLGRPRVALLIEEGVEQPSDLHGLVYVDLDAAGAWKTKLAKELTQVAIPVDMTQIPV